MTNRQLVNLDVAPKSIYKPAGSARCEWQHCVRPVHAVRWSITLRTRRRLHAA